MYMKMYPVSPRNYLKHNQNDEGHMLKENFSENKGSLEALREIFRNIKPYRESMAEIERACSRLIPPNHQNKTILRIWPRELYNYKKFQYQREEIEWRN